MNRPVYAQHRAGLDLADRESTHVWRDLRLNEPAVLVTGRIAQFLGELDMVHELAGEGQERGVGAEVADFTERRILVLD